MGIAILLIAVILSAAVTADIIFRPFMQARVGTGMVAHSICSLTFISGIDPDATNHDLVEPVIGFPNRFIHYHVDRAAHTVEASIFTRLRARARYTPGYGCRLEYPEDSPAPAPLPTQTAAAPDNFAPAQPVAATDPSIAAAIDRVFAEDSTQPIKDVKAIVVVKNGRVIAERYATGFGVATPLLSYSVAKSFTNALLGVLVQQGKLRADQPVGATEWSAANDPRGRMTIEDLLRMRSGLDAPERESALDPVAQMEYLKSDMAGFAANHPLKAPIGTSWEYTSANTLIIDRLLGKTVGGGAAGMRAFAERELFAPLHISSATMEFDGTGVFIGSSYFFASARDYARFGELYANDGVAPDGRRILPAGWVAWSRRPTLHAPYGAGFWINDSPDHFAQLRIKQGFPNDGFYASGFLGQRIYIIPSEHLVITRFGYSRPPDFGVVDDLALIKASIAATHDTTSRTP
jgi:CubicO group peptidase (beta-lactamase class C family)